MKDPTHTDNFLPKENNVTQLNDTLDQLTIRVETLEQSLSRIEATLTGLSSDLTPTIRILKMLPNFLAIFTDTFDEGVRQAADSGIDTEERLISSMTLLTQLTDPETLRGLSVLLSKINSLTPFIEKLDVIMGLITFIVDVTDMMYKSAVKAGVDPEDMVKHGAEITSQLSVILKSEEFKTLIGSEIFDPQAVAIIGKFAQSLVKIQKEGTPKIGLLGLLKAINDPDVQNALGFMTSLSKNFGRSIQDTGNNKP